MQNFPTEQWAYAGKFALLDTTKSQLLGCAGQDRPALYETPEAAHEAAASYNLQGRPVDGVAWRGPGRPLFKPVKLTRKGKET